LNKKASKVISLEPSDSFQILSRTFQGDKRVVVENKALSTDNNDKIMKITDFSTLNSFEMDEQKKYDSGDVLKNIKEKVVPCITLEDLLKKNSLPYVDLLKIDIEGYEYAIFSNVSDDTLKKFNKILIEIHHNENNRIGSIIVDKLKNCGFSVKLMDLSCNEVDYLSYSRGIVYATKLEKNVMPSNSLLDFVAVKKYANYDWGGGHTIQQIARALNLPEINKPKGVIDIEKNIVKNRIGYHLDRGIKNQNSLSDSDLKIAQSFISKGGYEFIDLSVFTNNTDLEGLITCLSTCEYFIGIHSGPMHVAAALGVKSIIIVNEPHYLELYLPRLAEVAVSDLEWLYPQNVHLHTKGSNELVPKFNEYTLKLALEGKVYPYWSDEYLDINSKSAITNYDFVEVRQSFFNGVKVDIVGNVFDKKYLVKFIDGQTNETVYQSNIGCGEWAAPSRTFYTDWLIQAFDGDQLIHEYKLDLNNKRVIISIDSRSLGDTVAWFPYVEEFRKKHNCEVIVSTFWNQLFEGNYPELQFINPGDVVSDVYATYVVGCFDDDDGHHKNRFHWRTIPIQKIATDILGLEYTEIKPKIVCNDRGEKPSSDYVCISEHSTFQGKYWMCPNGWQKIVNYIRNDLDMSVMVISKENTQLKNVVKAIDNPIEKTIFLLKNSKLFIGVSSGLAWLAWALDIPVVMISGMTGEFHEFQTGLKRIINKNVCNSCFNQPNYPIVRGDWNWCPRHKSFECTKAITPEVVKSGIDSILCSKSNNTMFYVNNGRFVAGPVDISTTTDLEFPLVWSMYKEVFIDKVYDNQYCNIKEGSVILDIGACIGAFSRFANSKGAKKIYSFEPDYLNYTCLMKNKSDSCIAFNVGVSSKTKITKFFKDINIGGHSLADIDVNKTRTGEVENIMCVSINDIMNSISEDRIDYMKLDTEGAEFDILLECTDDNLRRIRQMVVEFHHMMIKGRVVFDTIMTRMSNLGFNSFVANDTNGHTSMVYFNNIF
jgi:autotransporter strand-loop-strand O-heptosyltransferase